MPPKARSSKNTASTTRAVDDFLAQSACAPGQKQMEENKVKAEESFQLLREKYLDIQHGAREQINNANLEKIKVISNIFVGITAGIMGLGAFEGLLFWMFMGMFTSFLITIRVMTMGLDTNGNSFYFGKLLSVATNNMFGNTMTYMLFWIMFYNIVYVV